VASGLVALLAGGCLALAYWWVWRSFLPFTSPTPAPVTVHVPAEGEAERVRRQAEDFSRDASPVDPAKRLELSARDLNTLAVDAARSAGADLAGKVFLRLEDGKLLVDLSLPFDGWPGLSGRYLNASAEVEASVADGHLHAKVLRVRTPSGQEMPEKLVRILNSALSGWLESAAGHKDVGEALKKVKHLRVEGERLVLER
jgi:hypothetical protein